MRWASVSSNKYFRVNPSVDAVASAVGNTASLASVRNRASTLGGSVSIASTVETSCKYSAFQMGRAWAFAQPPHAQLRAQLLACGAI